MKLVTTILCRCNIMLLLFAFLLSTSYVSHAQKKKPIAKASVIKKEPAVLDEKIISYELLENGDTINRLDVKKVKHGKWVINHPAHYDDEGTIEVGIFDHDVKVGTWKIYSTSGKLQSIENFKQGKKDGEAKYYENGLLLCVGNYLALRSKYAYDTIMVEQADGDMKQVIVKADAGSVRHGLWTFYDGMSGQISRMVEYQVDEIIYDKDYTSMSTSDSIFIDKKEKALPHVSKKQPEHVWKTKNNIESVRYTDIPDNWKIKPNTKKK